MALPQNPQAFMLDPIRGTGIFPGSEACGPSSEGDTLRFADSTERIQPPLSGWLWSDVKHGPYDYKGNIWSIVVDTVNKTIEAWKSRDGIIWNEVDSLNNVSLRSNTGFFDNGVLTFPFGYGWQNIGVAGNLNSSGGFAALYVVYVEPDLETFSLAVFDLDQEIWRVDKAKGGGPSVYGNANASVSKPVISLHYRESRKDLILVWQALGSGKNEAAFFSSIDPDSGFGGFTQLPLGGIDAETAADSFLDSNDTTHVVYKKVNGTSIEGVTSRDIRTISISSAGSIGSKTLVERLPVPEGDAEGIVIPISSNIWPGPGIRTSSGKILITYWADVFYEIRTGAITDPPPFKVDNPDGSFWLIDPIPRFPSIQLHLFKVAVAEADSSSNPNWVKSDVKPFGLGSNNGTTLVETGDGNIYSIWNDNRFTFGNSFVAISKKSPNALTWQFPPTILTAGLNVLNCPEFGPEDFYGALLAQPQIGRFSGQPTFGMLFNRGTNNTDGPPDPFSGLAAQQQDPRADRFDTAMPVWYFGETPAVQGGFPQYRRPFYSHTR